MLSKSNVAVDQGSLHRRELARSYVLFSQKLVHRPSGSGGHEHAFGVHPSISLSRAAADEKRTRGA
jgi:hypothetical protein